MHFMTMLSSHSGRRRFYDIIFFAFLSAFIAAVENMFPRPIPYFRIGFSFIIIVIIIDAFSFKELLILIVVKNVSVALVFAYIFTPPFYLGIVGGLSAVIIMKFARNFKRIFSFYGVSILGATSSNLSQAYIAQKIFSLPSIDILIMPILILSLISGSVVGIFSTLLRFDKD